MVQSAAVYSVASTTLLVTVNVSPDSAYATCLTLFPPFIVRAALSLPSRLIVTSLKPCPGLDIFARRPEARAPAVRQRRAQRRRLAPIVARARVQCGAPPGHGGGRARVALLPGTRDLPPAAGCVRGVRRRTPAPECSSSRRAQMMDVKGTALTSRRDSQALYEARAQSDPWQGRSNGHQARVSEMNVSFGQRNDISFFTMLMHRTFGLCTNRPTIRSGCC